MYQDKRDRIRKNSDLIYGMLVSIRGDFMVTLKPDIILDFSSIMPIKINKGIAINVSLSTSQ